MSDNSQTQPSGVTTEETPPERKPNVITDETQLMTTGDEAAATDDNDGSAQTGGDSATQQTDNEPKKSRKDRSAERRIKRLQGELSAAQAGRAEDRERIDKLEAQLEEVLQSQTPAKKPELADFKDPEEYSDALQAWKQAQDKPKPKETPKPKADTAPTDTRPVASQDDLTEFHRKGVAALGDRFLAAQQDTTMAIDPVMGEFILDHALGADVFVYLHEHPEEMRDIFTDDSVLEKLESLKDIVTSIESGKPRDTSDDEGNDDDGETRRRDPKTGRFLPKETSDAPPPGPEADGGTPVTEPDPNTMGQEEYNRWRRQQMKDRRRF